MDGLFKALGLVCAIIICCAAVSGQTDNPYHLNGSARQVDCNCYTLTPDQQGKSGSLWNINKIDLSESFDFKFNIYLGCHDSPGADGIAFVLQPISTSVGTSGEGLGFEGISPSLGITVDTYQNLNRNDPSYDHIAIHKNGDVNNGSPNTLAVPISALVTGGNIEDCQWHTLRIIWDASAKYLKTEVDGSIRAQAATDLVNDVFLSNPMVFWGFTGATGGESNIQQVCTSLNPSFYLPDGQKTCYPEPISFIDSSHSFGSIVNWFWDFGDGHTASVANPDPHVFPGPGVYQVRLSILGNNGCLSDTFSKSIIVGSAPTAAFTHDPPLLCEGTPVALHDASTVRFGNINSWSWLIGTETSAGRDPQALLSAGSTTIQLQVTTLEGCVSEIMSSAVTVYPKPNIDFQVTEACLSDPTFFRAINRTEATPVKQWQWNFADGKDSALTAPGAQTSLGRLFPEEGKYGVSVYAVAQNGCLSDKAQKEVTIYGTRAFAGRDTILARNQPLTLQASGGVFYKWSPASGLSADNIANPVAILQQDASYAVTATSPVGCPTTDTIRIKVYKGPAFYVPNAFSPNNDGRNDRFTFTAVGMSSIDLFQVFNRYGQLIYSSPAAFLGWDGIVGGVAQPAGAYAWLIRGKDYLGVTHMEKGTVTLVR